MNIAFIVGKFPVLSESFVVDQITGLLDRGHEVNIYAFSDSHQSEVQQEVTQYNLLQNTTYISLPKNKFQLRRKALSWIIASATRTPLATVRLLKTFWEEKDFSYKGLFLFYLLHKNKTDIMHAHFGPNALPLISLKKANAHMKLITTFHGYDVTVSIRQKGEHVYDQLFCQGDLFTYNSEATKQKLLLLGCPPKKMAKLPMGINIEKIPFKPRYLDPSGKVRLLSVGRLVEMKGREYAIKAISRLKEHYPIQYDIVGDGPLREGLQTLIDELDLHDVITLHGWVSSERLKQMYQDTHLFIHPSVTSSDGNQEGQGVVLLEAQAHGIPVIATKHGAFPDSLIDGETGVLVPEKDAENLASTLSLLINNKTQWPDIGKKGRKFVSENFDSLHLNQALISLYESVK